jgi:formylglycine-generating enzyme required for sulfatase activity
MRTFRIGVAATFLVAACNVVSTDAGSDPTLPACGGPGQEACPPGAVGAPCVAASDCNGGTCGGGGKCIANAVGMNGLQDGDETDVDCGGAQSPKCADGKKCGQGTSCESNSCTNGTCAAPSPTDGIRNGGESDVDCGGANAPACAVGKRCDLDTDCASKGCGYKKVCVERPSCKSHFGGDTCGPGEPDEATNQNEDCCKSVELPVPGAAVMMDKYQITAGRFRHFLDAVNGNVRQFVQQHRPAGWDPTWDQFVPNGWDVDPTIDPATDPELLKQYHSSVWHQLGGSALLTKLGKDGKPFRYGCYISGNGTHTYRMPDNVQVDTLKDIPHRYSQEVLDTKALNCVTSIMLAAFCEWDWPGSRLPTYQETRFAWHGGEPKTHKYPWGNSPAPMGYLYEGDVFGPNSGIPEPSGKYGQYAVVPPDAKDEAGNTLPGDPEVANWKYNYGYPKDPWPNTFYPDFSAHIAAPGRFPKGNGPFGHADLAGNLFDLTSTISGTPGMHPDEREVTWGRNGAWEGHNIPVAGEIGPWTAPIMRKYAKAGGRCVKPK